jgi:hypothetical protein
LKLSQESGEEGIKESSGEGESKYEIVDTMQELL